MMEQYACILVAIAVAVFAVGRVEPKPVGPVTGVIHAFSKLIEYGTYALVAAGLIFALTHCG